MLICAVSQLGVNTLGVMWRRVLRVILGEKVVDRVVLMRLLAALLFLGWFAADIADIEMGIRIAVRQGLLLW